MGDEHEEQQDRPVEVGHSSPFEQIRQQGAEGGEYWSARDLANILGYDTNYRNFKRAIEKAETACVNSGRAVEDHFADARKMVTIGSGAQRSVLATSRIRVANHLFRCTDARSSQHGGRQWPRYRQQAGR